MTKQPWYKRLPWIRVAIIVVALLPITFGIALVSFGSNSTSNDKTFAILAGLSIVLGLLAWFFPLSPTKSEEPHLPLVNELVRSSFKMGDESAANFPYILDPIQDVYNAAKQALLSSSTGASHKRGFLILGEANAGKTRLAFEVLTQTLPKWSVLRWRPDYTINDIPIKRIPGEKGLAIIIDDLQEYVLTEMEDNKGRDFTAVLRSTTLRTLLETLFQEVRNVVFVVTCRLENEEQVQALLGELFNKLQIIRLPRFNVNILDPESAKIIADFQKYDSTHIEDWDGTLGSLVLGLSRKKEKYLKMRKEPAARVLQAMKLLWIANTNIHTESRVRAVCAGVFYEKRLQTDEKIWQEAVNQLVQEQFVLEEVDEKSQKLTLVIRKDIYFAEVITDYPSENRPHQLYQDLKQLLLVFVALKDIEALINLSFTLIILKRYEEALAVNEQVICLDPNNSLAYFNQGHAFIHLKRYEEALKVLDKAIHLDPKNADAYNGKGDVLYNLKQYQEALAAYEQAIHLDPNYARTYIDKGNTLIELNRYKEALETFEQANRLDPDNVYIYFNKGKVLARLKRYEEALDDHEQAIRLDPNNSNTYINKGSILTVLKRYEEALAAYEQAIHLNPNQADTYIDKGNTLIELNRYKEALETFEQAIYLDPNNSEAYFYKGRIFDLLEQYKEALKAYEQAIRIEPNKAIIYVNKGGTLTHLEKYEEALVAIEEAIHLDPNDSLAYINKGGILRKLKQDQEALAAYEQALELDPNNAQIYFSKGCVLAELERYQEALIAFKQALGLDPYNAATYLFEGTVLVALERYEEALTACEQALHLDPNKASAYFNKGSALILLKRYNDALEAYDQALALDPTMDFIQEDKKMVLELLEHQENV
jgi:tetratricopeptide (TPR) repeat protein